MLYFLLFVLYLSTVNPSVPPAGNSGELAISAQLLGVSHPTGYPTYTIISAAMVRFLPLGNIVYRVSILSGLMTAAGAGFLFLFLRNVCSGGVCAPFLVVVALGSIGTVWGQSVLPEIYSFHILLLSLVLYVSRNIGSDLRGKRIILAVFLCGLGLTNHLLFVFTLPYLFVYCIGRTGWAGLKNIIRWRYAVFFILSLSAYIYMPVRSNLDPVMDWGNTETAVRFFRHVSGHQFHTNMFGHPFPVIIHHAVLMADWIRRSLPFYFLAAVVIGAIYARRSPVIPAALLTSILLVVIIANYDIPDIENYYATIAVFLCIPAVYGIRLPIDIIRRYSRTCAFFLSLRSSLRRRSSPDLITMPVTGGLIIWEWITARPCFWECNRMLSCSQGVICPTIF